MTIDFKAIAAALEDWFATAQRPLPWREQYDPYHVWVSEIMLQQTRMDVAVPYFRRFVERFPTIAALAAASDDEVMAHWSGLGYYRRARLLQAGAREVETRFGGTLPHDIEALRTIPGIGRYTAGAIASIAFELPEPIVDGNVTRVTARLSAVDAPLGSAELERAAWAAAGQLVAAARSPRAFNQALMEHGAVCCTPRAPLCLACPVATWCVARQLNLTDLLPTPKSKPVSREMTVRLLVVRDPRGRVLLQREYGALMSGMFHLPHGSDALLSDSSHRFAADVKLGEFRHTITNIRITFELWSATAAGGAFDVIVDASEESRWVTAEELQGLPHASYVKKAFGILVRSLEFGIRG